MSFGFSVGDFVAGASLAYDLIIALSSSRGSSMEYQQLIQQLYIMHKTCMHVEQIRSSNQMTHATLNATVLIVKNISKQIEAFLRKTEKYRKSLRAGGSGSIAKDAWRKVGWSLFKPTEVKKLKEDLQSAMSQLGTLVSLAGFQILTVRSEWQTMEEAVDVLDDFSSFNVFHHIKAPPKDLQQKDPNFRICQDPVGTFRLGQVFCIIDTSEVDAALQATGNSGLRRLPQKNTYTGTASIRRYVVIMEGGRSSLCLGIHSYHGTGVTEQEDQQYHSMMYTTRQPPSKISKTVDLIKTTDHTPIRHIFNEDKMILPPVRVLPSHPSNILNTACRINYVRTYQIDHNVRISVLGLVHSDSIQDLLYSYQATSLPREESQRRIALDDAVLTQARQFMAAPQVVLPGASSPFEQYTDPEGFSLDQGKDHSLQELDADNCNLAICDPPEQPNATISESSFSTLPPMSSPSTPGTISTASIANTGSNPTAIPTKLLEEEDPRFAKELHEEQLHIARRAHAYQIAQACGRRWESSEEDTDDEWMPPPGTKLPEISEFHKKYMRKKWLENADERATARLQAAGAAARMEVMNGQPSREHGVCRLLHGLLTRGPG